MRCVVKAGSRAVIYGGKDEDPQSIHVEEKELMKRQLGTRAISSTRSSMLGSGRRQSCAPCPRMSPFTRSRDRPLHVDFLRLAADMPRFTINVPVHFVNQEASPGLKRGGVLNIVRHELDLVCDAQFDPR